MTGVNNAADAVNAGPAQRPTFVGADLRALHTDADTLAVAAHPAWHVEVGDGAVTVSATGADPGDDGLSAVRATARAVWDAAADGRPITVLAGDDTARAALERWSVLTPPDRLA